MHDAAAAQAPNRKLPPESLTRIRAGVPTLAEASLSIASALLLVLSFPDFDLWWLAWVGLVPLLVAVTRMSETGRAFLLGWLWGVIFFYGTCWWLTYPMIHYAHIMAPLAYVLLLLPVIFVALFPALFCAALARIVPRFGPAALLGAPLLWVSLELGRYAVTGQLWNALGYSQAFHPMLIQTARWGGVYAISYLILTANVAVALLCLRRNKLAVAYAIGSLVLIAFIVTWPLGERVVRPLSSPPRVLIIAIQPNVPMDLNGDGHEMQNLLDHHLSLTNSALEDLNRIRYPPDSSRLVIWPESPMNFSYSRDSQLRDAVATLA